MPLCNCVSLCLSGEVLLGSYVVDQKITSCEPQSLAVRPELHGQKTKAPLEPS